VYLGFDLSGLLLSLHDLLPLDVRVEKRDPGVVLVGNAPTLSFLDVYVPSVLHGPLPWDGLHIRSLRHSELYRPQV
jgi:hypothetical protein